MIEKIPGRKAGDFFSLVRRECYTVIARATRVCWMLFKIMVPVSIGVKVLKEIGFLTWAAPYFSPVMGIVGLPGELAIVWVSTMLTGLYGGILALAQLGDQVSLTTAQATVLTCMMLSAHAMIVELRICRLAGVRIGYLIALRMGFALGVGVVMSHLFSALGWFQSPVNMVWPLHSSVGWRAWAIDESFQYVKIIGVVTGLIALLRTLEVMGLTDRLNRGLRPFLRPLGIGESMAPMVVVGLTLGLAYGGGLIIEEARKGHVQPQDVVMAISMMCMCHSLIEDTILMLMLGGHPMGVIWIRIGLALIVTWALYQWVRRMSSTMLYRFLAVNHLEKG